MANEQRRQVPLGDEIGKQVQNRRLRRRVQRGRRFVGEPKGFREVEPDGPRRSQGRRRVLKDRRESRRANPQKAVVGE
ncbi:hypothetical protein [Natrinema gari]|uniref:hypothetical protein n=1 Tax=Natrinema gari TaxID=419186 RepID=UPI00145EF2EE|nr:hypothetical protein [Natrinema gari]